MLPDKDSGKPYPLSAMDFFKNLPVPAVHLDKDTTILQANPRAASLLGQPQPSSLLDKLFAEFLPEDNSETFTDYLHQLKKDNHGSFRTTLLRADSSHTQVSIKGSGLANDTSLLLIDDNPDSAGAGTAACSFSSLQDAQYHNTPYGILLVNGQVETVSFNSTFIELWDISPEMQESRNKAAGLQAVLSKLADPDTFLANFQRLYQNRTEVNSDDITLKDGRTFSCQTYPVFTDDIFRGRAWYFLDITEFKQAKGTLEKQHIFINGILEHIQDGIIVCDTDGRVTKLNRTSREFYRSTLPTGKTMTKSSLLDAVNDPAKPPLPLDATLAQTLAGEILHNDGFVLESSDGTQRTLRVNGQAMYDTDDNKLGAVITLHDITDLEKARNRLRFYAYHDTLTQLPNRRLFHDLLQQCLKQAKRNSKQVGILFVDLDNFKSVNDRYGHDTGDRLLTTIAGALRQSLRDSDILCR